MNTERTYKVAVLPGDGIGAEVTFAALPVFDVLGIPIELVFGDIGWTFWKTEGTALPKRSWNLIQSADATLIGAITSKPEREAQLEISSDFVGRGYKYVSPLVELRQKLDLFANVRPCFQITTESRPFNLCIIRENTEGLYAGLDFHPLPDELVSLLGSNPRWENLSAENASAAIRLQTEKGLRRLFEYGFAYAKKHGMNRVTFADKPNVLRYSGSFARSFFEETANRYPNISADIANVDAVAMQLVLKPQSFGVIIAENMFGDILSDVGAAVMGGLGFAPSANVGTTSCYFEPVHGSGPRMAPNVSNPSAMFLSIALLLEHLGFSVASSKIRSAVINVFRHKKYATPDVGGCSSTQECARAILAVCAGESL